MINSIANTQALAAELQTFIAQCETLFNNEIYTLFEDSISQLLRDYILEYAATNSAEPVRSALNRLGDIHEVQSLIDY